MAPKNKTKVIAADYLSEAELNTNTYVCGVPGPGVWLHVQFLPVSLFSLKMSSATSGVGRTLLVPTPYAVKMALLDAGLRSRQLDEQTADKFVRALSGADLRIRVPDQAVVTHTIVKIRQETKPDKKKPNLPPYGPNIAYREFVYFAGALGFCLDLRTIDSATAEMVVRISPHIFYLGKRGGFFQYLGTHRTNELDQRCSVPVAAMKTVPTAAHVAILDDFGPEANFDAMNSFSPTPIKRDRQRKFVSTVVPLGRSFVGPGFSHYEAPIDT